MIKKSQPFIIVAVVLIAGYFFWNWYLKWSAPKIEPAPIITKVQVIPVSRHNLFREEELPAEIEAYQDVLLYPKVPGFVKWLGADRGSVVKKDQLIATMYAPEYLARRNEALAKVSSAKAVLAAAESKLQDVQADLKKKQANLLADQSTYQRVEAASNTPGVIAVNDVIQWAQAVEADRQEVNTLTQRVNARAHEVSMRKEELQAERKAYDSYADFASYLEIRAPFDGYITDRRLHLGSFVGPDGTGAYLPIFRIRQLDLLRVVAPVPERDAAAVVAGSQVKFTVSSFPGRIFTGTVARISNNLDKATRAMPVELNYLNPDYKILPGMYCQVLWPIRRQEQSMFVPVSSVVTTQLDSFVCRVKDGIIERVSVVKGHIMKDMVEVFGNLNENDLVVKEANEGLEDQEQVEVI
ncbi:MAG: efflux RND transporter periplasmic adaptor subunit [Candidatus Obscuribacterales bacterium]|nr:efflux RND transporter periplasmic adaptor subunit [Candidatus Obscuribacterales bacterium]